MIAPDGLRDDCRLVPLLGVRRAVLIFFCPKHSIIPFVVHTPPLTIILALALILNKTSENTKIKDMCTERAHYSLATCHSNFFLLQYFFAPFIPPLQEPEHSPRLALRGAWPFIQRQGGVEHYSDSLRRRAAAITFHAEQSHCVVISCFVSGSEALGHSIVWCTLQRD